jgi:NADPH-dependent curcumin reductase CurA
MTDVNHRLLLVRRPEGVPVAEDFEIVETPIDEPGEGQVRVATEFISLDPAMRGWMSDVPSYMPPVGLGEVMRAGAIGKVTASASDRIAVGDTVTGMLGVQEHAIADASGVFVVDPSLAPLPTYLGALGMTGMTAYFGLLDVGALKEGETVVVSAAAGAVGSVVGQIAKLKGCRTVGIAGGEDKCRMVVDELGFDACIDYKAGPIGPQLREATPDRVDVYFDNVGGEILDAVLGRLAMHARVVICGAISQYNAAESRGPANYMALLVRRSRMEGFLVFDYAARFGEAAREMAGWIADGRLIAKEEIAEGGIAGFQPALLRLFEGSNVGKLVLRV